MSNLSIQAKNSIDLYKNQDPSKIEYLLKKQRASVVDELKSHFNANTLPELAIKLAVYE